MTDTAVHTVQFHSSDSTTIGTGYMPFFTISYVNTIGVESYYSYQSASAGLAGTGYVNTATGALAFIKPLLSTTDSLMPYTVSMTYNSDFAGKAYQYPNAQTAYSTSYMPYGFKLNINETIIAKKFTNESAGETLYYLWSDSDGTEHAFFEDENEVYIYNDEDGLQLTLTMDTEGEVYTLEDDNKTVRTFTQMSSDPSSDIYGAWYLTSITDKNNNKISFTFDSSLRPTGVNLTPNGSSTISFLTLVYNSNGLLSMIRNDTSKEAVVFRYSSTYNGSISTSSTKYLREIVYAHGSTSVTSTNWTNFYNNANNTTNITVDATAKYDYESNGLLKFATDTLSGYKVGFHDQELNTNGELLTQTDGKISTIQEHGKQKTETEEVYILGQSMTLTYGVYNTIIQTSGTDDAYGTADDLLTTYSFDTSARTVNCYTTDLTRTQIYSASSGQYVDEENEKAKNSLKTSVQKTYTANNYLLNGSFEKALSASNWSIIGEASIRGGVYSRSGSGCLRMEVNSTDTLASITQCVRLDPGDYSLSVYVTSDLAINCDMKMTVKDSNFVVVASENIALNEGYSNGIFALSELGFTISSSVATNYTVTIELTGNPTDSVLVFLDDVMLSKSLGATEYDLVQNGNFEITASSSNITTYWAATTNGTSLLTEDTLFSNTSFGRVMRIDSNLGQSNTVSQNLYQIDNDAKNDYNEDPSQFQEDQKLFALSGWAKGTSQCYSDMNSFAIGIEILYYNGSDETQRDYYSFDFANNITDWQFVSGGFSTDPSKGIIESITIYLYYSGHPGTVYFDGITLVQNSDTTSVFDYNINGDISSYQNGSNKTWYAYDNNNISIVVTSNGNIVEYTYDSQNRVKTEQHSKCSKKIYSPNVINSNDVTALYKYYYEYDNYGNRTYSRITDLSGSGKYSDSLTIFNTDSGSHIFGSVAEEIDALNNTTYYFYNNTNGRLMATIYPNREGVAYEYDAVGRLINAVPAYINEDSTDEYFIRTNAESVTYNYNSTTKQLEEIITATTTYTFIPDVFGNTEQINIGDNMLASYEYNPNNGKLKKLEYGNGFIIEYLYDALDRVSEIRYNSNGSEACTTVYTYTYDTAGNLSSIEDHVNNEVTVFNYDGAGKLMSSRIYDSETYVNSFETVAYYDDQSRVSLVLQSFNNATSSGIFTDMLGYSYEYNTNTNFISQFDIYGNYITLSVTPTYDNLGKTSSRQITAEIGNNQVFRSDIYYTYKALGQSESALVSQYASQVNVYDVGLTTTSFDYTYDDNGNITEIHTGDTLLYKYTYDYLGQLTREDNVPLNESYVFEYDNAGNILTKKTYSYSTGAELSSVSYSYNDDSWGDLLTNFNGTSITYDAIGNPTAIGYLDLAWEGRKLSSITRDGFFTINYGYNADGIRVYKEYSDWDVDETTRHEYLLNGTQIVKETVYVDSVESYTLVYLYDETGSPIGIKYRTPSHAADVYKAFFFEKNLQGDIIAIYNENGVKIGTYTYDAWGNFTVTVSSDVTTLESLIVREYNPYHYRGYYFDAETEWYYLQSRYYNPEWGRFINSDGYLSTGTGILGYNMFVYCNNNPVMNIDASGQGPITFIVFSCLVLGTMFLSSCSGFELQPGDEFDSQYIAQNETSTDLESFDTFSEALDYSYEAVLEKGLDTGYEWGTTIYINKLCEEFLVYGPYTDEDDGAIAYQISDNVDSKYWTAIGMVHNHPGRENQFCFSGGDYNVGRKNAIAIFGITVDGITMEDWSQLPDSKLPNYPISWD